MPTQNKHTPGPWEAFGTAVHATVGREIVFGAHLTRSGSPEERRANACLIAAAPELLKALEALAKHIVISEDRTHYRLLGTSERPAALLSSARAAIAKATDGEGA